jgi:hypothetical protein
MKFPTIMSIFISFFALTLFSCTAPSCWKAQQFRLKAMKGNSEGEKKYYEEQAIIYDQQCKNENDKLYEKSQKDHRRKK